jgi:predicted nuclease of predicted toxin-antitoxin system
MPPADWTTGTRRMAIWIEAQISSAIAVWIRDNFGLIALPLRDLGLRDAEDLEIFIAARRESAIVMTKDNDFVLLLERLGPPPQVILVTCGNTSNERMKQILQRTLQSALDLLNAGEALVEIHAD